MKFYGGARRGWRRLARGLNGALAAAGTALFLPVSLGAESTGGGGGSITWQRGFGGNAREERSILQRTEDGGFIIAINSFSTVSGNKTSDHFGDRDFWLVRTDAAGRELWQAAFGGTGTDTVLFVLQTDDGGYLLGGSSSSPVSGNKTSPQRAFGWESDFWIVKVNAEGEKEWDRSFGGSGSDSVQNIQKTADGGYLLIGNSRSPMSGNRTVPQSGIYDVWVIKIDAGGTTQWEKAFGELDYSYIESVSPTDAGGFVLAGFTSVDMYFTGSQFWTVAIDSEGETLWESTFGGGDWDKLSTMVPTGDGGFLLAGNTRSYATGRVTGVKMDDEDFWVVKIDSDGEREWDRAFGGNKLERLRAVVPARDGGFLIAGNSSSDNSGNKESPGFGESDYWVVKIDADGEKEWDRSFGGNDFEYLDTAMERDDGGFLIGGSSLSFPSGNKQSERFGTSYVDGWIVAVDAEGRKEWERSLGGSEVEIDARMVPDGVGGAVVAFTSGSGISGNKTVIGFGDSDLWMVKFGNFAIPVIVTQPENQVVVPGATATLRVVAAGTAPLSYQWMKDGFPLEGEIFNALIIENFQAADEGHYTVSVSNIAGTAVSNPAELTLTVPLAEALDAPDLTWTTSEGNSWFGQKEISYDGESAVRSGPFGAGEANWIETMVEGPGAVSFRWRVAAVSPLAELVFSVNGERRASISDDLGWRLERHSLAAGTHTLRWSYQPIDGIPVPEGRGWLDRVAFAFGNGGRIEISESIGDATDRLLAFGKHEGPDPARATVSIRNTDPENDLVIDRISLRILPSENSSVQISGIPEEIAGSRKPVVASSDDGNFPLRRREADWERPHDPSTILVRFKEESGVARRMSAHSAAGGRVVRRMERVPLDVVEVPVGADLRQLIEEYEADPSVVFAEPNYVITPDDFAPDPLFSELWALNNAGRDGGISGSDIGALRAWELTEGSEEIVVAVIDTGVDYTHPDLAENMWVNPSPQFGDIHGASWTSGHGTVSDGDPMDSESHGTHVAGTIGAIAGNGQGIAGVSPRVRIMALKFMKPGRDGTSGYTADAIAALEYAVANGAHISNHSWGAEGNSHSLHSAIDWAGYANHLVVASAGNEARSVDHNPQYPAGYSLPNIISVASSDRRDGLSRFSNYGAGTVHLAAPGSGIMSTVPDGDYREQSGTSMAAPHVTGAAALLFSLKPEADYTAVRKAILEGVTPVPALEGLLASGGRLNAHGALLRFQESLEFALSGLPEFPLVISPGENVDFEVVYQPTAPGSHEATVFIASSAADEPVAEIALSGQFGFTLAEALGPPGWIWKTGGNSGWGVQHFQSDYFPSAVSGSIFHNQESWLETVVDGPVTLSFWWKVSSEHSYDWLEFWVNGTLRGRITGDAEWHEKQHELSEGTNIVRWRYVKDVNTSRGRDRGWVALVGLNPSWPAAFAVWADRLNLPLIRRGALDRFGPLGMTNLAAFAMGLDPRTATHADLPRLKRSETPGGIELHYRRNVAADGVAFVFESAESLASWQQVVPQEDWVTWEMDGVQFRTARFSVGEAERLFLRLRFHFLSESPTQ